MRALISCTAGTTTCADAVGHAGLSIGLIALVVVGLALLGAVGALLTAALRRRAPWEHPD